MLTVALTGGIGSGKSLVSGMFEELQVSVIDADVVARQLLSGSRYDGPATKLLHKLAEHFGNGVFNTDGELDRARLRKLVFSIPENRKFLEGLLHPEVYESIDAQIKQLAHGTRIPYVIVVIPLLLETGHQHQFDRILVVDTPVEQQIQRAIDRDNSSLSTIQAIIDAQVSRKKRLAMADDVIENSTTIENVSAQVARLHEFYLGLN